LNGNLLIIHYDSEEEQRLDKFLVSCLPEHSRSRLQHLIKEGYVSVDGVIARKTGLMLQGERTIRVQIPLPEPTDLEPEKIPLDVIYEDHNLLVVNKPAGMVVHPSAGHSSGTLVHAALAHAPEMEGVGGVQRPGVVHRLDKNTSGIILLAKNDRTHRMLQTQFRLREIEKVYWALVDGRPPTPSGRIEAPIGRHPKHRKKMSVVTPEKGRDAVSVYHTLKTFKRHTYLEIKPVTGRTHQIRLHLAFIHSPVVGDTVYGKQKATLPINRFFLHAAKLTVRLPDEPDPRSFLAPLPIDLQRVLDDLAAD
jgi:23S rRNA pseudouridine1911/1915/1917 synthase